VDVGCTCDAGEDTDGSEANGSIGQQPKVARQLLLVAQLPDASLPAINAATALAQLD
jgi:hypothetical protein